MVPRNSSTARRDCNVTPIRGFILTELNDLLLLLWPAIRGRRAGYWPVFCDCIRIPDELHTDRKASAKLRWMVHTLLGSAKMSEIPSIGSLEPGPRVAWAFQQSVLSSGNAPSVPNSGCRSGITLFMPLAHDDLGEQEALQYP